MTPVEVRKLAMVLKNQHTRYLEPALWLVASLAE